MTMFKINKAVFFLILILSLATCLRLWKLDSIPPSLYSDEANLGYNAYSILKTFRDEHGIFLPVSLRSFGDWKPPLPAYLMIPPIYLFGLNEFSVRLPSAILGVGSVFLIYRLVNLIFLSASFRGKAALLSAFFLALSPWHLLQSRASMLVMVALYFLQLGVYFFLKGKTDRRNFYWGSFFLTVTFYAYYGMRLISPLLFLILIIYNYREFFRKKIWLKSFLIVLLMITPLILGFIKNPDVVFGRAKTVSVFYDRGTDLRLWELTTQDGISADPLITRFFHNRPYQFGKKILSNFFTHFHGKFLFLEGDKSQPFETPGMGILYLFDGIFIPAGLFISLKLRSSFGKFFVIWLIISIFPAALTFMVPSSNRTFNAVIPLSVYFSLGFYYFSRKIHSRILAALFLTVVYFSAFTYFMKIYFISIPENYSHIWNYGWKQATGFVQKQAADYDNIIVSDVGMPYIYFLFYNKYDPARFQKEAVRSYAADQFGFEHVLGFNKYLFINEMDWRETKNSLMDNTLYLVHKDRMGEEVGSAEVIKYQSGLPAVNIFRN